MPTYQQTPDAPDNYGCGVLSDGRIVTTDIGNEAGGAANGQLIIWFPPFDSDEVVASASSTSTSRPARASTSTTTTTCT